MYGFLDELDEDKNISKLLNWLQVGKYYKYYSVTIWLENSGMNNGELQYRERITR